MENRLGVIEVQGSAKQPVRTFPAFLGRTLILFGVSAALLCGPFTSAWAAESTVRITTPEALFQKVREMERDLEQAEADAEREGILLGLAGLYRQLHRYDRALESFERIRSLDGFENSPNRQTVLYQLGRLHEAQGRFEAAAEAYQAYVAPWIEEASGQAVLVPPQPPTTEDLQVQRGLVRVLSELGRSAEAKRVLLALAAVDDPHQAAYSISQLVSMYAEGNLKDSDLGDIADPLLSRFPDEAVRLAVALVQRDRKAAARYFFDEVLRRHPGKLLPAAETVADFYRSQDSLDQVVSELEASKSPSTDRVKLLIRLYRYGGDIEKAVQLVETRLQEQAAPDLLRELGDLRVAAGEYAAAAEAYEEYLDQMPAADSGVYREIGEAYYLAGDPERALERWNQIPQVLRNSPRAYLTLAEILDQYGFADQAVEMMEQAVRRAPYSHLYAPRLLNLYLKNARYEAAISQLTQLAGSMTGVDRLMVDAILGAGESPEMETQLLEAAQGALVNVPPKAGNLLLDIIFQIYLRSGDYDAAIEQLRRIPGALGEMRLYLLGQRFRDFGEFRAAAKAFDAIPQSSPYFTSGQLEAMNGLIEAGEYERALDFGVAAAQQLTGSATAAAAVAAASPDLFTIVSDVIRPSADWDPERRSSLENLLVSLADLWIRQKNGTPALAALLLGRQVHPQQGAVSARLAIREALLTGHAYALLGDHGNARAMYETACQWSGPSEDVARFMLAELDLWDGEIEKARAAYEELVQLDLSRKVTNEVLERLYFLTQLGPDETELYAQAERFAWRGRWEEAIDRFRTLAARRGDDHIAQWCLFAIGEILAAQGEAEAARAEWERLQEKTDDISLRGRLRIGLLELEPAVADASPELILNGYRRIIEEMPETIFADEARRRLSGS